MKFSTKLNELDIIDLLDDYNSELRKLKYKIDFVKDRVKDLNEQLEALKTKKEIARYPENELLTEVDDLDMTDDSTSEEESDITVKQNSTKSHPETEVVKIRKPQALSAFDEMILQTIKENGKATLSRHIYDSVKEGSINRGLLQDDEKIKAKLNQCLVKLTTRRIELVKVPYKGKGYAYALTSWYDEKGKLQKEYRIKDTK